MPSPTRRVLCSADVATLVRVSLGPGTTVVDCAELTGGGFAAVWRADLGDGRAVVVKVAPPPSVRLLRYEHDLTAAEAVYFRLVGSAVPDVPVPQVLHHGRDPHHGEWPSPRPPASPCPASSGRNGSNSGRCGRRSSP